jgi:DNA ligase-1
VKTFPVLYQRTQTGAIQQWKITVFGNVIQTIFGQVDGKLQTTTDTVHVGKNPGKKNSTTPEQQAEKEGQARWVKTKKKGYVESLADAEAGKVDETLILGGIEPMLAPNKSYPKDDNLQKAIVLPCFWQPKLDGMRCTAEIINGVCTIWSRTRKPIPAVPHIVEALEHAFEGLACTIRLDGELYNHDYRDRFEDLMSILRGDGPDPEGEYLNAQFHLYDCPEQDILDAPTTMETSCEGRIAALADLFKLFIDERAPQYIKQVPTVESGSLEDLHARFMHAEEVDGYEGGMARNKAAPYEAGKRSKHLQKMKNLIDDEFPIIGIEDGRGKDAGTVAKFIVQLPNGKEARPRLKATYARRRELFNDHSQWQGKKLTVTFKRWTADGSLYIPIGKTIRDYE